MDRRTALTAMLGGAATLGFPVLSVAKDSARPLRLGLIWSDTGSAAAFGKIHHDGSMLAVDEINAAGGVNGKPIEFFHLDDRSDPTVGINAAKRLITRDKVDAIVGSSASLVTIAFSKVNEDNKIPLVNGMAGSPGVTGQGFKYTWRVIGTDVQNNEQLAQILVKDKKLRKFAFLAENSDYGKAPSQAFADKVKELGGEVTAFELENRGDTDFKPQLTKIKNSNPEVLYIHAYYIEGGIIARQAKELGIKAQLVVNSGLGIPEFSKLAGDAAVGVLYPVIWSPLYKDDRSVHFVTEFHKKWGYDPASGMEAGSYDAVYTVAEAVKLGGGTKSAQIQDGLGKINAKQFGIVLGTVHFDDHNQNLVKIKLGEFNAKGEPVPVDD